MKPLDDATDEKPRIKCVIWDLDNTLWEGTLLENDKVTLREGAQDVIRELDNRGILQSIASKSDLETARQQLTSFGLNEYFLYPEIGWGNKSDSIRRIAQQFNIGLNTVAFVDDQAFERDEVRYLLPEVITIDASDLRGIINMPAMQRRFVTLETQLRRKMYQADIERKQGEQAFKGTRKEFLLSLRMRLTIRSGGEQDLRRAEELTARTSQLNTTGYTYSYSELLAILKSSDHKLLVADLEDRYGTFGTIGLALIETKLSLWRIKLLIVSCRVMTRGVGDAMLTYILQSARRDRARLQAEFVPNNRNRITYVTYKFHGFSEVCEDARTILLEHPLCAIRPFPPHITLRLPKEQSASICVQRGIRP